MDPLSIAASIAGLLSLTQIVATATFNYVKEVKGASKDVRRMLEELDNLVGILSQLQHVITRYDVDSTGILSKPIRSCLQIVEKMQKELVTEESSLNPPSNYSGAEKKTLQRRIVKISRSLVWPFSKAETESMFRKIKENEQTLSLALKVDGMEQLILISREQKAQSDLLAEIRYEQRQVHLDEERRQMLNSIAPYDPRKSQETASGLHKSGTGLWFTEGLDFRNWLASKNSKLWLHGDAGVGKTILMGLVVQAVLEQARTSDLKSGLAFFYCDYQNSQTHDILVILGCLAKQLAIQSEECFSRLEKFYKQFYSEQYAEITRSTPATADDFCTLIKDMCTCYDQVSIIVDALDECGTVTNQSLLAELLISLTNDPDNNIRTVYSSRNNVPDLEFHMEGHKKISIAAENSDLKLYVASEIEIRSRIRSLRMRDPSLTDEVMNSLVNGADGMWRWVTCQIDSLCTCTTPQAIRQALKTLPPDLSQTYERILDRVNKAPSSTQTLVHRVLKWMVCANEPLTIKALLEAVSLDEGKKEIDPQKMADEDGVLRWCSSLVRKSSDGKGLELAHSTVKEFLEKINKNGDFGIYKVDKEQDNLEIAKICLTYLELDCFDDGDLRAATLQLRKESFPLFNYAATQWPLHANAHLGDEGLENLIQVLLDPSKTNHFMCWSQNWMHHEVGEIDMDQVSSTTTLHWAAMLGLHTICKWLLSNPSRKIDIDKLSYMGTPLCCALRGKESFLKIYQSTSQSIPPRASSANQKLTVQAIIDSGASVNDVQIHKGYNLTPLCLTLALGYGWEILLSAGAKLDAVTLTRAEDLIATEPSIVALFFQSITETNTTEELRPRYLQLGIQLEQSRQQVMDTIMKMQDDPTLRSSLKNTSVLRNAALAGQTSVVATLLKQPGIDIDFRDRNRANETPLHGACRNGHFDIVKALVEHGADKNMVCDDGWNSYHFALLDSNLSILRYLEEQGTNVDALTNHGDSALHLAAIGNNISIVPHLLQDSGREKKLSAQNKSGRTPIALAAQYGSVETVQYLLREACSDVVNTRAIGNISLFHDIAGSSNLGKIQLLRNLEFDIYDTCNEGKTVLHYLTESATFPIASLPSSAQCIAELLEIEEAKYNEIYLQNLQGHWKKFLTVSQSTNGAWSSIDRGPALVTQRARNGATALQNVTMESPFDASSLESLEFLCERQGMDVDEEGVLGLNPLLTLAWKLARDQENEHLENAMIVLIKAGADLNRVDRNKQSSLAFLVQTEDISLQILRVIQLFLSGTDGKGSFWETAKPELQDASGISPIETLLSRIPPNSNGDRPLLDQVAKMMVKQVPAEFLQTTLASGNRLLNIAVESRNEQVTQAIIDRGVSVGDRDATPSRRSALELVCINGISSGALLQHFISEFKTLRQINTKDANGLTPLHLACENGHENVVQQLVTAGVDVELKSDFGFSPIHYAIAGGKPGIVELLLEHNVSLPVNGKAWNFSVLNRVDNVEICRLLNDRGVDWQSTITTPFHTRRWIPDFSLAERKDRKSSSNDDELDSDADDDDDDDSKVWESRKFENISPAHVAVWKDRTDVFSFLMDHVTGIAVDVEAEYGLTPLHLSVLGDNLKFTLLLLARKANPNAIYSLSKWTPLHFAALVGSEEIILELLSHGGNTGALDLQNRTPSLVAWEFGHKELSRLLKDREIQLDIVRMSPRTTDSIEPQDAGIISEALVSAIKKGDTNWCKQLVDYGCDVNGTWTCSCSPLVIACRQAEWEVADYLISVMQSIRGTTCADEGPLSGFEALHYAACAGQHEVLEKLLEKDSFPDKIIVEAFRLAAQNGHTECLRILYENHHEITTRETNRSCCKDWDGHITVTDYDEDDRTWKAHDCLGASCLHCATIFAEYDTMKFLLEIGADIEARDEVGDTPLIAAMAVDDLKMMEILLHSGANPNIRRKNGKTPLFYVANTGSLEMLQLLAKYDTDVSILDLEGKNALHHAFSRNTTEMADALIGLGMDPMSLDSFGSAAVQHGILNPELEQESLLKYLPTVDTVQSLRFGSLFNSACYSEKNMIATELLNRVPQIMRLDYINRPGPLGTPLYAAACDGNVALAKILLEHGAEMESIGGLLGTPLFGACEFGRIEAVKLLLRNGANLCFGGAEDQLKTTMYAARCHKEVQSILKNFMVKGIDSLDDPLPLHTADLEKLREISEIISRSEERIAAEQEKESNELAEELMEELEAKVAKFVQTKGGRLLTHAKDEDLYKLFITTLRNGDFQNLFTEEVEEIDEGHTSSHLHVPRIYLSETSSSVSNEIDAEAGWETESGHSESTPSVITDQKVKALKQISHEKQPAEGTLLSASPHTKDRGLKADEFSLATLGANILASADFVFQEQTIGFEQIQLVHQVSEDGTTSTSVIETTSFGQIPVSGSTSSDNSERRQKEKARLKRLLYKELSQRL